MTEYSGFCFTILQSSAAKDWFLLQSETRPREVAHAVERRGIEWHCVCEDTEMNKPPTCKHRDFIGAVLAEIALRDKISEPVA